MKYALAVVAAMLSFVGSVYANTRILGSKSRSDSHWVAMQAAPSIIPCCWMRTASVFESNEELHITEDRMRHFDRPRGMVSPLFRDTHLLSIRSSLTDYSIRNCAIQKTPSTAMDPRTELAMHSTKPMSAKDAPILAPGTAQTLRATPSQPTILSAAAITTIAGASRTACTFHM